MAAVNEFEIAAHQDPSESNLFDWASELLLHRTLEPAIETFRQSAERFPNSPRMAIGLGIALYSRGNYEEAVKSLLRAADLSPSDPICYFFLSKAYDSSPSHAEEVIQRFARFSELQPNNAHAFYYYAMSLWKGKRAQDPGLDLHQIEALLKKAIVLDPKLTEAHLQLGNLYSDQTEYAESIPEYVKALEINSDLADAHYRLGQAYVHTGAKGESAGTISRCISGFAPSRWPIWTNKLPTFGSLSIRKERTRRRSRDRCRRGIRHHVRQPAMHHRWRCHRKFEKVGADGVE